MSSSAPSTTPILPALSTLRSRISLRLLSDTVLPAYKGALLRGGFGFAFQRSSCPQTCWGRSEECKVVEACPFRQIFEPPRPHGLEQLHDLKDAPRPFVLEPPLDKRRAYRAGDVLEFHLVLIGRGIDFLPHFIFGFEQLGRMGLGQQRTQARLERVEALEPYQPIGRVIYRDGEILSDTELPLLSLVELHRRVGHTPADLHLTLSTPLRVKSRGDYIRQIDLAAIVRAACWRISALTMYYGDTAWDADYQSLVALAAEVSLSDAVTSWEDWERTSTRGPQPRSMKLGGIVGTALLKEVPPAIQATLLAAGIVHVGKACVFGHGQISIIPARSHTNTRM
jgi:hypothetical protein